MSAIQTQDALGRTAERAPRAADLVLRAGAIHAMDPERNVWRSLAVRDEWIIATAEDPNGIDHLISDGTRVLELRDLTIIPAFIDTHEHMLEAARNLSLVPVDQARSIAELVDLIRVRAATTPPGQWIQTSIGWNEANLAEGRLPTATELDQATREHPVLARRGGHTAVANTPALQAANLASSQPDPAAGKVERSADGALSGILEGGAVYQLRKMIPPPTTQQDADALARVSRAYAAFGVGTVREALLEPGEFLAYQRAWARDALAVRARPMLLVDSAATLEERMSYIEGLGMRSGFGDDRLQVWGLKFVLDGGVAGAAVSEPYADNPANRGHLNWDPDELFSVMSAAVRTGWKIATHAVGDRSVVTLLDTYERIVEANPDLPPGSLIIEHGFLADPEQRARAIRLGVAVTVQHQLLYNYGRELLQRWGEQRTARIMPIRSWLDEGALVAGGTDAAKPFDTMLTLWGFITRGTREAGTQGQDQCLDPDTALALNTAAGAQLLGESDRLGTLRPGRLADMVALTGDPLTTEVETLPSIRPALTLLAGRPTHDPDGWLSDQ